MRRPGAIGWVSIACAFVVVTAILVWGRWDALDDWAPNIATEAISIAITVGLVGWLIERGERRNREPLRKRAMARLAVEHQTLCECVALDYEQTHPDAEGLPANTLAVLDRWINDDAETATRALGGHGHPRLLDALLAYAEVAARTRDGYPGVLDVELVAAIHDLERVTTSSLGTWEWIAAHMKLDDQADHARFCLEGPVEGVREFGIALSARISDAAWTRRLVTGDGKALSGAMTMGHVSRAWEGS